MISMASEMDKVDQAGYTILYRVADELVFTEAMQRKSEFRSPFCVVDLKGLQSILMSTFPGEETLKLDSE